MTSKSMFLFDSNSATAPLKTFKCDIIQQGIWYLPIHDRWITAGVDFVLRQWTMSEEGIRPYGNKLVKHSKKITKVIDIRNPKLIISCGLDGYICLWDGDVTSSDNLVNTMEEPNQRGRRGVRCMTYNYEFGGNVLTCGFETHIKVWQPEVSTTRPFQCRLEGHNHTVVCCEFIKGTPNAVSIDEKGNIRIWDIRTLESIQGISAGTNSFYVSTMCPMSKLDKFIIGGKRLLFYQNSIVKDNGQDVSEIEPMDVYFNEYFNNLVVMTK